jgi:hypothetical protein
MINNEEKLELINLKIFFWTERLKESNNAISTLNTLGNQFKIDGNALDIKKYSKIIEALEAEKEALTNQG